MRSQSMNIRSLSSIHEEGRVAKMSQGREVA